VYNKFVFDFIAELIYPKRCVRCHKSGDYICDTCFAGINFLEYQLCAICQKGSIDGLTHPKCRTTHGIDGIFSSIAYKGIVKKLLYQYKYPPYLSDLKGVLGKLLYEGLIQQEAFEKFIEGKKVWITAVPLHSKRLRKRGYNQSELLGKELAMLLKIPYVSDLLLRTKQTKPQFELKKDERQKNILGAFTVNPKLKMKLKEARIIIVDDITTSGATLRECGKVLKQSRVKHVMGVTLAHEV
jgi:ComF family protein